jgi:hypothetical protein
MVTLNNKFKGNFKQLHFPIFTRVKYKGTKWEVRGSAEESGHPYLLWLANEKRGGIQLRGKKQISKVQVIG